MFSSPSGCVRYAQLSFRVDSFPRMSSQRQLVNGVLSEESGNGPWRRARFVSGRNIKAIGIFPADLLQVRAAVASWACEVD